MRIVNQSKILFLLLFAGLYSIQCFADITYNDCCRYFTCFSDTTMPKFTGGEAEMAKYLTNHLKYPEKAKKEGIKGTVFVSFIIDEEGTVKEPTVVKGIGGGCDEEALRIISAMPKWTPGSINGKKIPVKIVLPIKFVLSDK